MLRILFTLLLVVPTLLLAVPARAQMGMGGRYGWRYGAGEDAVGLNFMDTDPSSVRSPAPGGGGTLQSQEWRAFGLVPVYGKGTDTVWSVGAAAEQLSFQFSGFSAALSPALISNLYGEALLGNVLHRVDEKLSWLAYLSTGRYADEWPAQSGGRTSGGGIFQMRTTPTITLGAGAGFTYVFGEPRAVPILSFDYREGPWSVDIRYPFRADTRYAIGEKVRVGAEYFVQGGQFDVTDSNAVDTVRYSSQLAGALVAIGPFNGLQFQFDAGTTVYRHYTALNNGATALSLGFNDAMFYRGGVVWRW